MKMKRGIIIIRLIQKKKKTNNKEDYYNMGFSLWSIFKSGLLMANAFAILHETRFLPHYNLHVVSNNNPDSQNFKQKAAGLLLAARYMRFPLIGLNFITVVLEMLFG